MVCWVPSGVLQDQLLGQIGQPEPTGCLASFRVVSGQV
jgi:hypothetical protein